MNRKQFFIVSGAVVLSLLVGTVVSLLKGSMPNGNPGIMLRTNPPPAVSVAAEYHVNLPNGIMLVDSQGKRTGKDPATGNIYREIPGTSYAEDGLSPTNRVGELYFSEPSESPFILYILGGSSGAFWLDASYNSGPQQVIRGNIKPGSMNVYSLNVTAANIASSTVVSLKGTMSFTASITSAPPHNLPLPIPGQK